MSNKRLPIGVLGYSVYYYEGDAESYNSIKTNSDFIDEVVVSTYNTDGKGNLHGVIPSEQMTVIKNNNIRSYLLITNRFSADVSEELMRSRDNRRNFIYNTLNVMKAYEFDGVNIDFEGVFYYNREDYLVFLREFKNILSYFGYLVTVSIPGKTYDNPRNTWNGAFDYERIGKIVDSVQIMTYDEHYLSGSAGPVASLPWVEEVMKYAISRIPKEKLYMGLASYGYDWGDDGSSCAYKLKDIPSIVYKNKAKVLWDNDNKSNYFHYTDSNDIEHVVWFDSNRALEYKLEVCMKLDISGVAIWRLGQEDTSYWDIFRSTI